jgi:multiple antibiotic resistance protein
VRELVSAFVTLFVTIDPPGLAPLFLGVTAGMSRAERGQIALRATLIAFGVLTLFAVAGTAILSVFGITIHAFRIAGGLLLFFIAFEMIFEKRQERHERSAGRAVTADRVRDIAVFPLAIPLIAGPGAISATILLSGTYSEPLERAVLILILAVNLGAASRRDRAHRADAAPRHDPRRAGGSVRPRRHRRRHARRSGRLRRPLSRGLRRRRPAPAGGRFRPAPA